MFLIFVDKYSHAGAIIIYVTNKKNKNKVDMALTLVNCSARRYEYNFWAEDIIA